MAVIDIHPDLTIIENSTPDLHATPGQFCLAVPPTFDPYLPQVLFPFRIRNGTVSSFIAPRQVQAWWAQGSLKIRGAYGKGFTLAGHEHRALVLATNAASGALLIPLVDSLVARNCEVVVLGGPDAMRENWLPPEVEFHVVDDIIAASSDLWAWTDAVYASGHSSFYARLSALVKQVRLRLESGWAQVLLHDLAMPCGTGVCYLCTLRMRRGLVLNCRDGPVHDLADWTAEA
jgi:hypothetical protein